jgi:hypothetical protein
MSNGYWIASGQFLEGIGKLLGIAKFPLSANRRQGRIAKRLLAKIGQYPSLFSEALHFC